MRLLLAEDEVELSNALVAILEHSNYEVDTAFDGEEALKKCLSKSYDGIILDIMMPKKDGIEVLQGLRNQKITTPILMLSAKAEVSDRIHGLDMGADDYLTKPFAMGELLARVRAMKRRNEEFTAEKQVCGNVTLARSQFEMTSEIASFRLSKQEFLLMELFMSNPGCSIPVSQIMERVWKEEEEPDQELVWVYVSYLQKKLQAMEASIVINGNQDLGYQMEVFV